MILEAPVVVRCGLSAAGHCRLEKRLGAVPIRFSCSDRASGPLTQRMREASHRGTRPANFVVLENDDGQNITTLPMAVFCPDGVAARTQDARPLTEGFIVSASNALIFSFASAGHEIENPFSATDV